MLQELANGVLVVLGRRSRPRLVAVTLDHLDERADGFVPELARGLAALVRRGFEAD